MQTLSLIVVALVISFVAFLLFPTQKTLVYEAELNDGLRNSLNSKSCEAKGGLADDEGLKTWCWDSVTIPEYSDQQGVAFSERQLKIDSECHEKQVTMNGDRIKFVLNPTAPYVGDWCSRDFNMRAEISTAPWHVKHRQGTEEWFGWNYTFGDDYVIDKNVPWLFFQVHPGIIGVSPHTELLIIKDNQFKGHEAGEVYVANAANGKEYKATGIVPKAGQTLKVVVHAIWGNASNGLLQVWINDQKVYDQQVATVYENYPWGGNAKWGIYKWRWANEIGVQQSIKQGITSLETYLGTLRIITRKPGNPDFGKDAYQLVVP